LIRRTSKIILEIAGIAFAVVAVLIAVLAWRLSSGPISISILNEIFEEAARPTLQGGALDIGDTMLIWAAEERELALRLSDVTLHGADGNEIARVPQLAFELSVPALFRGTLAPTSVELYRVSATVLRRPGTGVTLALGMAGEEEEAEEDTLGPLLEALLDGADRSSPFSYLTRFGIREAQLTFVDEVNGVTFEAPSANLSIYRGDGGIAGRLDADFAIADKTARLEMSGFLAADSEIARIDLTASNVVPAALARLSPAFSDYDVFDAPLHAEGEVEIRRDGALRTARLMVSSGTGEINLPEPWATTIPLEKAHGLVMLDGEAQLATVDELSFKAGPHEATVSGTIGYEVGDGLNIARARVDLRAEDIHTEVPGFFAGPVDVDLINLAAALDFDAMSADINELYVGTAGGGIRLSGRLAEAERSPAVAVTGEIEPMPFDAFKAIWPFGLAKGAREWVEKNLSGGTLEGGSFNIDFPAGMIADIDARMPIPKENLRFEFTAKGQTMHYLGDLPPMENLVARGLVEGNRFDAWVTSATIRQRGQGDIAVSDGHFYVDEMTTKGAPGYIAFAVSGAMSDILSVLDHEPLGFISDFGLDPLSVGGTGRLEGKLSLPLVKNVQMGEVDFSGKAHTENVVLPEIQKDLSVTAGTLDLAVDRSGLSVSGPIVINHAAALDLEWRENFNRDISPRSLYRLRGDLDEDGRTALGLKLDSFIAGVVTVDATLKGDGRSVNRGNIKADLTRGITKFEEAGWEKPAGVPASVTFDLELMEAGGYRISDFVLAGDEIDTQGSFALSHDGRLVTANMPVVKLGAANDFSFRAGPSEDAALRIEVKGHRFDARGVLSALFLRSEDEKAGAAQEPEPLLTTERVNDPVRRMSLIAEIDNAIGHNDTSFSDVVVRMVQVEGRLWSLDVAGKGEDGTTLSLIIAPDATGKRQLTGSSMNAGEILRTLDFTRSVRGGTFRLNGAYDDSTPGSPLSGVLTMDKFRIVDAPVLANILTLGSLTGIGDTMRGDGIFFERLELPFAFTEARIHMKEARMSGPAIGLTASGQIDRAEDLIDLEGTLVPAYTINSFLGQVPVLGPLIVGREGEGVFAITYGVRGKTDDPSVVVNPLSAIAPGFLRRIFEFGSTLPPEGAAPTENPQKSGTSPESGSAEEEALEPRIAPPEPPAAVQN
jgi:hypothetical protein